MAPTVAASLLPPLFSSQFSSVCKEESQSCAGQFMSLQPLVLLLCEVHMVDSVLCAQRCHPCLSRLTYSFTSAWIVFHPFIISQNITYFLLSKSISNTIWISLHRASIMCLCSSELTVSLLFANQSQVTPQREERLWWDSFHVTAAVCSVWEQTWPRLSHLQIRGCLKEGG